MKIELGRVSEVTKGIDYETFNQDGKVLDPLCPPNAPFRLKGDRDISFLTCDPL